MALVPPSSSSSSSSSSSGSILLPNVAAPFDPRLVTNADGGGANVALGQRVVIPATGTLHDLSIYVGATGAGNIDVGIYSTAATRVRLYSTGSIACPAINGWRNVGDPNLAVTLGDQYDFVVAPDGAQTFGSIHLALTAVSQLPTAYTLGQVGIPLLSWFRAASFPLPASAAEGGLSQDNVVICIIGRIT